MMQAHKIYVIIHVDSGLPSPRKTHTDQPLMFIRRALSTGDLLNMICDTNIHSKNIWSYVSKSTLEPILVVPLTCRINNSGQKQT